MIYPLLATGLLLFIMGLLVWRSHQSRRKEKVSGELVFSAVNYDRWYWIRPITFTLLLLESIKILSNNQEPAWTMMIPILNILIIMMMIFDSIRASRVKIYKGGILLAQVALKWDQVIEYEWIVCDNTDYINLCLYYENKNGIHILKKSKASVKLSRQHEKTISQILDFSISTPQA